MNKFASLFMLAVFTLIFNSCNSPYQRVYYHEYPDYPLYHAVQKGDVAEAKRLVEWHRQNNQPIPDNLLFAAVDNTDKAMADLVLGLGLDWDKRLNDKRVIDLSNLYMKGQMYDHGYPVDPIRHDGASTFWHAGGFVPDEITAERLEFLEMMLSRGANINFVHNGQTALDTWHKSYSEYYEKVPAKKIIKDRVAVTSEEWEKRKSKMITFLRQHGGKLASELPKDAVNKPE